MAYLAGCTITKHWNKVVMCIVEVLIAMPLFFYRINYMIYEYPDDPEIKLDAFLLSDHIV